MEHSSEKRRRSIRLPGFDYSQSGSYFLTICIAQRRNVLGSVSGSSVRLTSAGEVVRRCWIVIPSHFAGVDPGEYIIMPDHLHGIVHLNKQKLMDEKAANVEQFGRPAKASIPTIVRTFKAAVTRNLRASGMWKEGSEFWQRNYYERVIRDGDECDDVTRYIAANPIRWSKK